MSTTARRFRLGRLLMTPGAQDLIETGRLNPFLILGRHICGDWGEVNDEDKASNDRDVLSGNRLLSAYLATDGTRVWVITEADRSATTILLPGEY